MTGCVGLAISKCLELFAMYPSDFASLNRNTLRSCRVTGTNVNNRRFLILFSVDTIDITVQSLLSFVLDAHGTPSDDVVLVDTSWTDWRDDKISDTLAPIHDCKARLFYDNVMSCRLLWYLSGVDKMNGIFFEHSLDNAPSPIIRENVFVVCNKHGGNAPDDCSGTRWASTMSQAVAARGFLMPWQRHNFSG